MDIEQAVDHALDGDALLFTGAGFSVGALNLKDEPFKRSLEFARALAQACGVKDDVPLEVAAEDFREKFGDDALISAVQNEFTTKAVSSHHICFTTIPWRRIYTTNYDNVMEFAYAKKGIRLSPVITEDRIQDVPKGSTLCVHLNGFIDRLNRSSLEHDFKLLETAYLASSLADSPWLSLFRADTANARAVFVVGYSLSDIDIARVLFSTDILRNKTFFVLGRSPVRALVRRAERVGQVMDLDTQQFAKLLAEKHRKYTPRAAIDREPSSFTRFRLPADSVRPRDADVLDLLLLGNVQPRFTWESLQGRARYFLRRSLVTRVVEAIEAGARTIVVHSALGNGKSLALEGLRFEALQKGYDVYSLANNLDDLASDIDVLRAKGMKAVLMVDNYSERFEPLRYLAGAAPDQTALVLAARTVIHDVVVDELEEIFPSGIVELSADILSPEDIEWVRELLDEYGLWGKLAAKNVAAKRNLLQKDCNAEFHQILLMLLESPQIRKRLEDIQNALAQMAGYGRVVSTALILAVLGFEIDANFLSDIWGGEVLEDPNFRRNIAVRQLLNFETGRVVMRSAVVAGYLLKKIANAADTAAVLTEIGRALDKRTDTIPRYRGLLTRIMRFSTVQELLPESGKLAAVLKFYESVKDLNFCHTNPLFWLQYAIAMLTLGELPRAEKYFDTAYSHAKSRGWNTFQIDNHYARFLLMKAIASAEATNCMEYFRKARTIINEQIGRERRHYRYRVAKLYFPFYERFEHQIRPGEREEVVRAASYVLERIERLPGDRRRHPDVVECERGMQSILSAKVNGAV